MRQYFWIVVIAVLVVFGALFWVYQANGPTQTESDILTSTDSGLAITNPTGYETWYEGGVYEISWTAPSIMKVSLEAATGGKPLGLIVHEADANDGSYTWTIPEGYISNFGIDEAEIVIRIFDSSNEDDFFETEPILIKVK